MAKHVYLNRFAAHLQASITSGQSTIPIYPEEITNLLLGWEASSWLYLTIMDNAGNTEIIKMTGLSGNTLTVERGQGGTTAKAFGVGCVVACRLVAEHLGQLIQKGVMRSGAYNPNGVLTGNYLGEKFYQTGPAAEQRRWWMWVDTNRWRLMCGSMYGYEWLGDEDFIYNLPNFINYSDPSYWTPQNCTWDDVNLWWETDFNTLGMLVATGTWPAGKRWLDAQIAVMSNPDGVFLDFGIWDSGAKLDLSNGAFPAYYCEEIRPLTWGAVDFESIEWDARGEQMYFRVFFNEGNAAYDFQWETTSRLAPANWTPVMGSWDTDHWVMQHDGTRYVLDLNVNGSWANGYMPNRLHVTTDSTEVDFQSNNSQVFGSINPVSASFGHIISANGQEITLALCNFDGGNTINNIHINTVPSAAGKTVKIYVIDFLEEIL